MITVDIDLGRLPSVEQVLENPRTRRRVVLVAAESYYDDIKAWISSGQAFTSHTGELEQAIGWHPLGVDGAQIYANKQYADWVEHGTKAHVIRPRSGRKGLKIPQASHYESAAGFIGPTAAGHGYIVRREVHHPGSKAKPYFFADMDNRKAHMADKVLEELSRALGGSGS